MCTEKIGGSSILALGSNGTNDRKLRAMSKKTYYRYFATAFSSSPASCSARIAAG